MRACVYVTLKREVLDPQGEAVKKGLTSLGIAGVQQVRVGKIIEIEIEGEPEAVRRHLEEAARKLLANPVIEDYRVEIGK